MGLFVRLAIFVVLMNIAATMVPYLLPGAPMPIEANTHETEVNSMQQNVTGFQVDQTSSNILFRIFDYITLGFITKIIGFVYNLIFGFIPIILTLAGAQGLSWLSAALHGAVALLAVLAGIEWYINKDSTTM